MKEDNAVKKCQETEESKVEQRGADAGDNQSGPPEDTGSASELNTKLEEKTRQVEDYVNLLQRTLAEFDNYKKRTAKEKEELYITSVIDIMTNVLPIMDNMEKALESCTTEDPGGVVEGVGMILRQFKEMLKAYDICEIEAVGQRFDPELHEAVAHIEDSNFGEGEVVEEFRKGYRLKDRVIRHSMVKVAN